MVSAKLTTKERAIKTGTLMMQEDSTFQRLGATLENIEKGSAIAHPIPFDPPVTTTRFCDKFKSIL